jgi:ubiquinone/menaquinone biosynthesis C-methylase UbiE
MTQKPVSDAWAQGDLYERYVGRWSRLVAPRFVQGLNQPAARRWLDVGCGTGALCEAIIEHAAPSSVHGVDPSPGFLGTARQRLGDRVNLQAGTATAIPLADASVDVVVSALVLNFVPDQQAALMEMARVAVPGGTIAAYVWDYADKMQLMRAFWDAAIRLDPAVAGIDEMKRFPSCRPEGLTQLFRDAGLADIEVGAIDIDTPFVSFDDYWAPFEGGQGPAPSYAMSLDEAKRQRLRDALKASIPTQPDGSISMIARAWAVRSTRR